VRDDAGNCRGIVALDWYSMRIEAFPAMAVMLATGGPGIVFGRSTNSIVNTGTAASAVYQQGAYYGNGEFIQVHPTAIPGEDKLRLISESVRGEGGRMWTWRDGKKWYFLEDMYPAYGNLVPRDIASRAVFKVVFEMGLGVDGQNAVYLDVTHKDPEELTRKLGGVLEIYEKFKGADPRIEPMKVFPAMHYSMGGLWVDYDQMTNVPGLFAVGEVDYQYHGANRLGANSLLSCLYGGMVCGPKMLAYGTALSRSAGDGANGWVEHERKRQEDVYERVYRMEGRENPYALGRELGEWMTQHVTVERYNKNLQRTDDKIVELKDRWGRIGLSDRGRWLNQEASFVRQLWNMLELARVITLGALARDESRGAHYKPDFPQRDDGRFLKTTKARWTSDGPSLSYEDVDVSMIKPRVRKYDTDKTVSA